MEFERGTSLVCEMSEAWDRVDKTFRRFIMRRFTFALIYKDEEDFVLIVSVFHPHRRPNSWRKNQ